MYENIRKHLCNKIMNVDDNELGQLAHALLYAEDEGYLNSPLSMEDNEQLDEWEEDLKGVYGD